jgi:hypothetical protein
MHFLFSMIGNMEMLALSPLIFNSLFGSKKEDVT